MAPLFERYSMRLASGKARGVAFKKTSHNARELPRLRLRNGHIVAYLAVASRQAPTTQSIISFERLRYTSCDTNAMPMCCLYPYDTWPPNYGCDRNEKDLVDSPSRGWLTECVLVCSNLVLRQCSGIIRNQRTVVGLSSSSITDITSRFDCIRLIAYKLNSALTIDPPIASIDISMIFRSDGVARFICRLVRVCKQITKFWRQKLGDHTYLFPDWIFEMYHAPLSTMQITCFTDEKWFWFTSQLHLLTLPLSRFQQHLYIDIIWILFTLPNFLALLSFDLPPILPCFTFSLPHSSSFQALIYLCPFPSHFCSNHQILSQTYLVRSPLPPHRSTFLSIWNGKTARLLSQTVPTPGCKSSPFLYESHEPIFLNAVHILTRYQKGCKHSWMERGIQCRNPVWHSTAGWLVEQIDQVQPLPLTFTVNIEKRKYTVNSDNVASTSSVRARITVAYLSEQVFKHCLRYGQSSVTWQSMYHNNNNNSNDNTHRRSDSERVFTLLE